MNEIKFTIPIEPKTKKNSGRICRNKYSGKTFFRPSEAFEQYQKDCGYFVPKIESPINYPINVKAVYYMKTKRKVDKTNLESALLDVLVHYSFLEDDNRNIVYTTDGSKVLHDCKQPRTEITISRIAESEFEKWEKK